MPTLRLLLPPPPKILPRSTPDTKVIADLYIYVCATMSNVTFILLFYNQTGHEYSYLIKKL